uniref:Uncharacterized protein n=1 Tax=Sphaerodactylus townsendi TaxID=933632 RepID=A0ACB8EMX9_9SAUR
MDGSWPLLSKQGQVQSPDAPSHQSRSYHGWGPPENRGAPTPYPFPTCPALPSPAETRNVFSQLLFELSKLRSRLPRVSLEKTLLEVSKELEETAAVLQDLRAQCSFLHGNPAGAAQPLDDGTVLQALKLAASDFGQLLVAFEQVHRSELRKHCERPVPPLSPCGPLFKALQWDLSLCVQELKSLAQITETSENIVNTVDRQQEEKIPWRGSAKATLPSKLKELREKYKVIDALLHELSVIETHA